MIDFNMQSNLPTIPNDLQKPTNLGSLQNKLFISMVFVYKHIHTHNRVLFSLIGSLFEYFLLLTTSLIAFYCRLSNVLSKQNETIVNEPLSK